MVTYHSAERSDAREPARASAPRAGRATAYVTAALGLLGLYSCEKGPTEPQNTPPTATVTLRPGEIYPDTDTLRMEIGYNGSIPENLAMRRTFFELNGRRLTEHDGHVKMPLRGAVQAGDRLRGCAQVSNGTQSSPETCAEKTVLDPNSYVTGRVVWYVDSTAVANQPVGLKRGDKWIGFGKSDANGNFSAAYDKRNAAPDLFYVFGVSSPSGGRKFHDYRRAVAPSGANTNAGTVLLRNQFISPKGAVAFSRWKYLTAKDGRGANTYHACWEGPTVDFFPNAQDPLAGLWPEMFRAAMDGPEGWHTKTGYKRFVEVAGVSAIGIIIRYVAGNEPNGYSVETTTKNGVKVPKKIEIRLRAGTENLRTVLHELGHAGYCLWDEDWFGGVTNGVPNEESVMGSAERITPTDIEYGLLSGRQPFMDDVSLHLNTASPQPSGTSAALGPISFVDHTGILVPRHVAEGRTLYAADEGTVVMPVTNSPPEGRALFTADESTLVTPIAAPMPKGFVDRHGLAVPQRLAGELGYNGIDPASLPRAYDILRQEPVTGLRWNDSTDASHDVPDNTVLFRPPESRHATSRSGRRARNKGSIAA